MPFGAISTARRLDEFDGMDRKAVRLIKYKGLNKTETENEYQGRKGYAIAFEGFIQFLSAILPSGEKISKGLRRKMPVYPDLALRELIVNALIHQDFTIGGTGPMVEIFDDRVEISNPGRLLPSKRIERLIGTNPESRNEVLSSAFRRYNICEERGTGFIKAVTAIEMSGLPPLEFEEGENYFKATISAPKPFAAMSVRERLDACYQHAILKYLSSSALTNTSLRERLRMSERQRATVSRLIFKAVEKGLIKPKDPDTSSTKFAEYIPYWG